jgi:hypothetical protein
MDHGDLWTPRAVSFAHIAHKGSRFFAFPPPGAWRFRGMFVMYNKVERTSVWRGGDGL